jgi:hypothetical protein
MTARPPTVAASADHAQPCPDGRFLIDPGLLATVAPALDVIVLQGSELAIEGVCPLMEGHAKATARGVRVNAHWWQCGSLRNVRLRAKLPSGCRTMTGTVKAKKVRRARFTATASSCGDGIVDAGNGEECDPSGVACATGGACTTACRCPVPSFAGMGPCEVGLCWTPGEPVVAVGPSHVVQTVNAAAAVYNKLTGVKLTELDFGTFWGADTVYCVDPRALYIASADRFAISCSDSTANRSVNPVRFAISQTGDPTGSWYRFAAPNAVFLDQDKIEATSDKFVVAGDGNGTVLYVYDLADVTSGVPNPMVVELTTAFPVYQAAVQQTPASPAYFVTSYPGAHLVLATVTGTPAAGDVALRETMMDVDAYPAPHEAAVAGGLIGADELDGRIYDAIYEVESQGGSPIIQYSSARACGDDDCITSGRIDLSGPVPVLASHRLIGAPGWDYTYGAVGLDGMGNVFEVYTRSNASTAPGVGLVGPGFDVTLQAALPGTTSCPAGGSPPCDERWGDYFGTAIDPSDPATVWVTGSYQASSGGYGWGTIVARVSMASAATLGR